MAPPVPRPGYVIDFAATTPVLTAIFGSKDYAVGSGCGDVALRGAVEYQGLHSDNIWTEPFEPAGGITTRDTPAPWSRSTSRWST